MLGGLSRGILAQESVSSSEQRKRVAETFVSRSPSKSRFGGINLGNVRKRISEADYWRRRCEEEMSRRSSSRDNLNLVGEIIDLQKSGEDEVTGVTEADGGGKAGNEDK